MEGHQPVFALGGNLGGHLIRQFGGGSALFGGEGEHTHVVKALLRHEIEQMLEVFFGFARIAHDEGGAQHRIGQLLADAAQHPAGYIRLPGAIHRAQHLGMAVLQRQIQVRQHIGHLAVSLEHRFG